MKLNDFESYDEYVRVQTETNKLKINNVWVSDKELVELASYIKDNITDAKFGLCHGVRNGYEVIKIKSLLEGVEVVGTEISETADDFDSVIQWDFHEVKDEWVGKVDFIYSNSWDHSYDPELLFDRWMSCLSPNGRCFIHWTPDHSDAGVGGADCFGASLEELKALIEKKYEVEAILNITDYKKEMTLKRKIKSMVAPGAYKKEITILVVRNR